MASTWDLFRGDTSGWSDRSFFRDLIREYAEPVLDVGCGTGRHLLDYLSQGVDIDGVDVSPEMLALCRSKADAAGLSPTLYEQRMEELDVPRSYRVIMVPSSSFQLLTDQADAARAMLRFVAHLQSGGVLAMPLMELWWKEGQPTQSDWRLAGEAELPHSGGTARKWSRARFDPATQLEHTEDRYEVTRDGVVIAEELHSRSPATRSYTQREGVSLFKDAGLTDVQVYKGFTRETAVEGDSPFTVVGVRR